MIKGIRLAKQVLLFGAIVGSLSSCKFFKEKFGKKKSGYEMQVQTSTNAHEKGMVSQVTGIPYNLEGSEDGGSSGLTSLTVNEYKGQPKGPNLVFIEGGRFVMGSGEEEILYTHNNVERTISIQSFFMDATEMANNHWLEFMNAYNPDNGGGGDLPDIPSLFEGFADKENEEGAANTFDYNSLLPDTTVWARETAFNDSYVANYLRFPGFRYFPVVGVSWVQAQAFCRWRTAATNANKAREAEENGELPEGYAAGDKLPLESGIILPDYRLPTEAEWEYAAKALIGTTYNDANQSNGRIYPWNGHSLRNPNKKQLGRFLANFKRGRGDYAGIAGKQNDGALITEYIRAYPPNDYGLYNMAGNVNEWVEDVYRPLAFEDVSGLNPVRRRSLDSTKLTYDPNKSVYGDPEDQYMIEGSDINGDPVTKKNSLVTDNAHVYKGGSWKDVAYWLTPGTRRFMDKNKSADHLGFRCAMIMAGEKDGENRRTNKPGGRRR